MGHEGGPKQPPTATSFGGGPEVPNTQSTVSQVRGWPANPATNILPNPQQGSREMVLDTRYELQSQPPPGRILRQLFARVFGNIGESGHGFPFDGGFSYVPHLTIPRTAQRNTGPHRRMMDDNAPIPAIYAGNPRRG